MAAVVLGDRAMWSCLLIALIFCIQASGTFAFVAGGHLAPTLRGVPPLRSTRDSSKLLIQSRPDRRSLSMGMAGLESVPAVLLSEEIFGQVAAGGLGIIASGLIGALIVGNLVNLDELEEEWGNRSEESDTTPDEESEDEEYDEGDTVVAKVKKD